MFRSLLFALGGAFALANFSFAQAPASKDAGRLAEIRFADGSVVRMTLLQETLEVQTKYGKLLVPTNDVRRVDMGLHIPEGMEQTIETSIRMLSSEAFKQREEASRELVQAGHWAFPALQRASQSNELETSKRATSLIARISERSAPDNLKIKIDDVVQTREFPIVGRITSPTIKAYSPLFGEQSLKLCDLRSIHLRGQRGETEMVVDAVKYGSGPEQWFDTGITVDSQLRLIVTGDGQVDLWPQTPGQYIAGPRGFNTPGKGGTYLAGALIGRVGETGKTFLIGDRYEATPTEEGKLYLQIVASPWNNASSGSFRARLETAAISTK